MFSSKIAFLLLVLERLVLHSIRASFCSFEYLKDLATTKEEYKHRKMLLRRVIPERETLLINDVLGVFISRRDSTYDTLYVDGLLRY